MIFGNRNYLGIKYKDIRQAMQQLIEVKTRHFKFECMAVGNKDDELVILLHGFPETAYMWRNLMTDLARNELYCLAPNLRGYSKDACPKGKKNYKLEALAGDIIDISKALNRSKFHLVGHDWGAAIGWKVVYDHPDTVISWTGLSLPHLQAFGEAIVNDKEQQKMSRYIRAFQWPWLPEIKIRKNDFKLFRKLWKQSETEEINAYLQVFRNPNQLTAALNYYRANYKLLKKTSQSLILGEIKVPTLFIWGNKDIAIGSVAVENGHQYMKSDYNYFELDAGHWLVQTEYKALKSAVETHINKYKLNSN